MCLFSLLFSTSPPSLSLSFFIYLPLLTKPDPNSENPDWLALSSRSPSQPVSRLSILVLFISVCSHSLQSYHLQHQNRFLLKRGSYQFSLQHLFLLVQDCNASIPRPFHGFSCLCLFLSSSITTTIIIIFFLLHHSFAHLHGDNTTHLSRFSSLFLPSIQNLVSIDERCFHHIESIVFLLVTSEHHHHHHRPPFCWPLLEKALEIAVLSLFVSFGLLPSFCPKVFLSF